MEWRTLTCENDQAVTLFRVPDLAASQQHVVQIQRVALLLPQHRPRELVQAIVRFFALDETYAATSTAEERLRLSSSRSGVVLLHNPTRHQTLPADVHAAAARASP